MRKYLSAFLLIVVAALGIAAGYFVGFDHGFEKAEDIPTRDVVLFYYDADKDRDNLGNIQCSRAGLVPVVRSIPRTNTPIQDAITLLLRGEISDEERAQGVSTEFPLSGVALKSASLSNGALTLEFADPNNRTGGGSCRVAILWAQIEATATQIPEGRSARFVPEELFQ